VRKFRSARDLVNLRQGRNDWYKIKNLADRAEIMIYDEIGYFGVTASDFVRDLKAVTTDRLDVHLNTPGGEVFDGIAIYNALRQHPAEVHVTVDSLAASIGSVIAMAGDRVVMARNATMMIHDGFGMGVGNAADMRELADLLDKTSDNIASIYAERTGKPADHWRALMREETWFTADEAVEAGLADEVQAPRGKSAENSWDLSIFARSPGKNATSRVPVDSPEDDKPPVEPHPVFSLSPDDFRLAVKEAIVNE
jgi:ATP-dependent protease ClpP protease subunit